MEISWEMIVSVCGAISVVGGAWLTIRKIQKDARDKEQVSKAEILQAAKEELALKELALQNEIHEVKTRVENLEKSVEKDLAHMRETYNGEIRNLGQKIEDLRSELRNQHGQLVQLLTKMISKSKD